MLLAQITVYVVALVQTHWLKSLIKLRWLLATSAVGIMIVVGAVVAESQHAFALANEPGEAMAREREVRHSEPQLGEAFRPHSWYAGEI